MKLSQFVALLGAHPDKPFRLVLPGENVVPASFHITEVGYVAKKFIDCGGRLHATETCLLQAWLGGDTDHRLLAGKMAGVLTLAAAKGVLPSGKDLDVEIEYEDTIISQYMVADYAVTDSAVVLSLAGKHTDCLAKEACLPTALPMAGGEAAGCGPGCCG